MDDFALTNIKKKNLLEFKPILGGMKPMNTTLERIDSHAMLQQSWFLGCRIPQNIL